MLGVDAEFSGEEGIHVHGSVHGRIYTRGGLGCELERWLWCIWRARSSGAAQLGVSAYTVRDHVDHACEKVGVRGRKALLAKLFFDGYAPRLLG